MFIDGPRFRGILQLVFGSAPPTLTVVEAETIVRIGYLAIDIDLEEDSAELVMVEALSDQICALAGIAPSMISPLSPLPTDDEERAVRVRQLASRLTRTPSRELAYVVAYVLIVADLELSPVESRLLLELETVLEVSEDRTSELAAQAAEMLTPPPSPEETRTET